MNPRNLRNTLIALAAAGALSGAAFAGGSDFVLANFEEPSPTNNLYGYWFYYTDATNEGNSKVTTADSIMGGIDSTSYGPGYNSIGSGRMGFRFGDKMPTCGAGCTYDPEVGYGTDLRSTDSVGDLTGAKSISFWAKSNHALNVLFIVTLLPIKDYSHYRQTIVLGPAWKKYTIELKASAQFAQPTWGKQVPWSNALITSINWAVTKFNNKALASDTLMIDDITIDGWDPTGVRFSRAVPMGGAPGIRTRLTPEGDLRLLLPEDLRRRSGLLRVDDLMGREVARTLFRGGQDRVIISRENLGRAQGPFFVRSIAKAAGQN